MMRSHVSEFPVGESIHVDDMLAVVEADTSRNQLLTYTGNEKISAGILGDISNQTLELVVRDDIESFIAGSLHSFFVE
jgi:hypothetical protein